MEIVSGTGVFANASGQLLNHGTIDLNAFTLAYSARAACVETGCGYGAPSTVMAHLRDFVTAETWFAGATTQPVNGQKCDWLRLAGCGSKG